MTEVGVSLQGGEEWWRDLTSAQKAAILQAYFEKDGVLSQWHTVMRNRFIAQELGIHPSSVAVQRRFYLRRTKEAPVFPLAVFHLWEAVRRRQRVISPEELPPPGQKGGAWWSSLTAEAKKAVVRPLLDMGLSSGQIGFYLDVTRNQVVGVRDRMKYPTRPRLPRTVVYSLDKPIISDSKETWHNFIGAEDPGFGWVESKLLLQALLDKRKLAGDAAAFLKRLVIGDDLEEHEYLLLAAAIRQHPELLKMLEHA